MGADEQMPTQLDVEPLHLLFATPGTVLQESTPMLQVNVPGLSAGG